MALVGAVGTPVPVACRCVALVGAAESVLGHVLGSGRFGSDAAVSVGDLPVGRGALAIAARVKFRSHHHLACYDNTAGDDLTGRMPEGSSRSTPDSDQFVHQ